MNDPLTIVSSTKKRVNLRFPVVGERIEGTLDVSFILVPFIETLKAVEAFLMSFKLVFSVLSALHLHRPCCLIAEVEG